MFSLPDAFNVTAKLDRATRLLSRPLVRTHRPGFYPGLDERARLLLRAWSRLPAISGRPRPTDQMIFADMLNERVHRTVSVARRILDLEADLAQRLAFPSHFTRGEVPDRIAGHAGGIVVGLQVADRTAHRWEAKSVSAALDRRLVEPRHVALAWTVAGGMAVQTTRMRQHFSELGEHRRRSCRLIGDRGEAVGCCEAVRLFGHSARNRRSGQQGRKHNKDLDRDAPMHRQYPLPSSVVEGSHHHDGRDRVLLRPREIASRIGENHGADGLVVFDVAGAAAQMTVKRLSNGLLKVRPRHRLLRQTLEQNLALVQESGRTVAALERKMLDEGLLQNG